MPIQNRLSVAMVGVACALSGPMMSGLAFADSSNSAGSGQSSPSSTQKPMRVTALELNQNLNNYVGKQISLAGRVDRVLGNGSYIIADTGSGMRGSSSTSKSSSNDSEHRVLIFTSNSSGDSGSGMQNKKQQGGVAAQNPVQNLKDGDRVQLSGKAEQFNISSEVDTFSPKSDNETINETAEAMPVVVIQPGNIKKSS